MADRARINERTYVATTSLHALLLMRSTSVTINEGYEVCVSDLTNCSRTQSDDAGGEVTKQRCRALGTGELGHKWRLKARTDLSTKCGPIW